GRFGKDLSPSCLIRRFASAKQAVYNHKPDADANRRIRQVEGEPVPVAEVEIEEIHHRAAPQPVDDIADGAADDETDGNPDQRLRGPAQPHQQAADDDGGDHREDRRVERGVVIEQAETHAAVPGEHEIEEAGHRLHALDRLLLLSEQSEYPRLAELIGDGDDRRHREPAPQHHARRAGNGWPPSASTAAEQRSHKSGCAATVPTSVSTRQQRWHLSPGASATTTATPATSGSVKAPAGGAAAVSVPVDVMQISARSSPSSASM